MKINFKKFLKQLLHSKSLLLLLILQKSLTNLTIKQVSKIQKKKTK
jgi:hypothetical protein